MLRGTINARHRDVTTRCINSRSGFVPTKAGTLIGPFATRHCLRRLDSHLAAESVAGVGWASPPAVAACSAAAFAAASRFSLATLWCDPSHIFGLALDLENPQLQGRDKSARERANSDSIGFKHYWRW